MTLNTEKLKSLRKAKGLRQFEVAEYIGYTSRNSYSQVENGRREPDLNKVSLLASLYNVTVDELLK